MYFLFAAVINAFGLLVLFFHHLLVREVAGWGGTLTFALLPRPHTCTGVVKQSWASPQGKGASYRDKQ